MHNDGKFEEISDRIENLKNKVFLEIYYSVNQYFFNHEIRKVKISI